MFLSDTLLYFFVTMKKSIFSLKKQRLSLDSALLWGVLSVAFFHISRYTTTTTNKTL